MKTFKKLLTVIVLMMVVLPLSSCMHTMMMGGHDDHAEHQASTVSKEIVNGDFTLSVTIEPLIVGKEGNITLFLRSKNDIPENVAVHYMISKSSAIGSSSAHDHGGQTASSGEFKTIHQNIIMAKGVSTIPYYPTTTGNFVLTMEIEKMSESESSLSAEVSFIVLEKKSNGMMGMGGMWDYPVLGVLMMGTMMIGVWMIRGGIF